MPRLAALSDRATTLARMTAVLVTVAVVTDDHSRGSVYLPIFALVSEVAGAIRAPKRAHHPTHRDVKETSLPPGPCTRVVIPVLLSRHRIQRGGERLG